MADLRASGKRDVTLGHIGPNAATHRKYRDALQKTIARMNASYLYWIRSKYVRAVDENADAGRIPDIAQDAKPGEGPAAAARRLLEELTRLRIYWTKYFDDFAKKLAEQTADDWQRDNSLAWQSKLKRAGFDIKMQLTPSQTLILHAKVQENVSLIKSIQQDYHKDIEGIVTRNFLAGRDLHEMAEKIKARGDVTTRRAALIARDQSNKATAQMNAARQRELGLDLAVWQHSSAGKEPRHEHVKAGRERWVFDTQKGIDFGDGFGYVLPGEAINCRCTSRTIIPAIGRETDPILEVSSGKPGVLGKLGPKVLKSPWSE